MLQVIEQEERVVGLTYMNKKEICDDFWSKLTNKKKDFELRGG